MGTVSASPAEPSTPVITVLAALAFRKHRCENTARRVRGDVLVMGGPMSIVAPKARKHLSADALFRLVRSGFATIPDSRCDDGDISLTDALMSAFAMFSLKAPSLLAFDKERAEGNLHTIYGIQRVPCDTHMREILDPVSPESLRPVFKRVFTQLQRGKALEPMVFLEDSYLL